MNDQKKGITFDQKGSGAKPKSKQQKSGNDLIGGGQKSRHLDM